MTLTQRVITLVALAVFACGGTALAQTTVTTNGTTGSWVDPGTWTGGVVPNNNGGNTYNVQILNTPSTVTISLDGTTAITVNDLQLQSGSALNALSGANLTLSTLENSGTFTTGLNSSSSSNTSDVSVSGDVMNNGSLTLNGTNGINATLTVGGTFTNNGSLSVFGTGNQVAINALNNTATGSLTIGAFSGATINITGGGLGITDIASAASVDIGGTF